MKKHSKYMLAGLLLGASMTFGQASADNHTVKKGETLWSISSQYKVNLTDLKAENNLGNTTIFVGQTLYIPGTPKEKGTHIVKSGDTLWSISVLHKVSLKQLTDWNNLSSNTIKVGQVLVVSEGEKVVSVAPSTNTSASTHVVKSGDTLYKIATTYKLTLDELKSLNKLTTNTIYVGQKLNVSVAQHSIFIRPTEGYISSHFGQRSSGMHYGIDYAKTGTVSVKAAAEGTVSKSYVSSSYGEVIFVIHNINGKTYETVYAHLKDNTRAVKVGDKVQKGQHIGYMGNTGISTGQHLHFEIHEGLWNTNKSNAINPTLYLPN